MLYLALFVTAHCSPLITPPTVPCAGVIKDFDVDDIGLTRDAIERLRVGCSCGGGSVSGDDPGDMGSMPHKVVSAGGRKDLIGRDTAWPALCCLGQIVAEVDAGIENGDAYALACQAILGKGNSRAAVAGRERIAFVYWSIVGQMR